MEGDSTASSKNDQESQEKKLPYPKSVFFIVSNEFCERFSFYGMRTILSLYLVNMLLYSESDAKIIYHSFTSLAYFFPLLGAVLSDSLLGKFRTIFYLSIVYAIGNVVLAMAASDPLNLPQKEISILGLLLIALGTGGIKPCVSAFGGDQFIIPQQTDQLEKFFSMFYFSINAGSLISTFLTPELRENVHCFGNDSCYPLAFGIPGILMIVSIVIFVFGKPLYRIKKPEGNIIVKVSKCIGYALKNKRKSKKKAEHWLDYAEDKYGKKLVDDIKITLKVLVLYTPLPIFWALYDQQGTGWTFQANRMNGDIGFYTILPDQMQVINPLLILAFIPLFSYIVYPAFAKCNLLKSPLQRMVWGGFLTALSFAISALISMQLEATYPELPSAGNGQLRIYNPLNCHFEMKTNFSGIGTEGTVKLNPYEHYQWKHLNLESNVSVSYTLNSLDTTCNYNSPTETVFNLTEKKAIGLHFQLLNNQLYLTRYIDAVDKPENGLPLIRTLTSQVNESVTFYKNGEKQFSIENDTLIALKKPGEYILFDTTMTFNLGGVYTVLADTNTQNVTVITTTEPNSVHMLWLIPQYVIITAGEIMFSITGLEFSYSQAPVSMKSVLQAAFLLTTAVGDLIIVIIESAKIFDKQSLDFFLYTGLMVLDMVIFAFLAYRYKYIIATDNDDNEAPGDINGKELNGYDNPVFKNMDENKF